MLQSTKLIYLFWNVLPSAYIYSYVERPTLLYYKDER